MNSVKGFDELLLGDAVEQGVGEKVNVLSRTQLLGILRELNNRVNKLSPTDIARTVAKLIPDEIIVPTTDTEKVDNALSAYAKRHGAGSGYITTGKQLELAGTYSAIGEGLYTGGSGNPLNALYQGYQGDDVNKTGDSLTDMPEIIVDGNIFNINGIGSADTNIYPSPPEPQLYAEGYETAEVHAAVTVVTDIVEFAGDLYCTTMEAVGKVYRSTDAGTTWAEVFAATNTSTTITGIAVFNNVLYVCTNNSGSGCDIYSSADGTVWGASIQTFTGITSLLDIQVIDTSLYVGVTGASELWVSTDGATFNLLTTPGETVFGLVKYNTNLFLVSITTGVTTIYTSNDSGTTWAPLTISDFTEPIQKLGVIGAYLVAFVDNGIWRSVSGVDGTWENVVTFPLGTISEAKSVAYSTDGTIYVAYSAGVVTTGDAGMSSIFGSADGKDWYTCWDESRLPSDIVIASDILFTFGCDNYISQRNVKKLNNNEFLAKGDELFIATEDHPIAILPPGLLTDATLGIGDIEVLCIAQGSDGTLYAGTRTTGLVMASINNGKTWSVAHTIAASQVRCLAVGPDGYMYAGDNDGRVHYFNGTVWAEAYYTGTTAVHGFLNDGNFIYALCDLGKIFQSPGSLVWAEVSDHTHAAVISGTMGTDDYLYIGTYHDSSPVAEILRSNTGGASWDVIHTSTVSDSIYAIVEFQGYIYASTQVGVIRAALGTPTVWEDVVDASGLSITKMTKSTIGDKIYALSSVGNVVYESSDGITWTDTNLTEYFTGTGVSTSIITCINGSLFIGTNGPHATHGGRVYRFSPTFDMFERKEVPVLSCCWFDEVFWEEISEKDFVYPGGIIQNTLETVNGLPTVIGDFVGADTYSLFSDVWQSPGDVIGRGYVWSSMSSDDKNAFADDPINNMCKSADGSWLQGRLRKRGVIGSGAKWTQATDPADGSFLFSGTKAVKPKGKLVTIQEDLALPTVNVTGRFAIEDTGIWKAQNTSYLTDNNVAYNGKCFAIPGVIQQLKRNKRAYHRIHNPCGTAWCALKTNRATSLAYLINAHDCNDLEGCVKYHSTDITTDGSINGTMVREDGLGYNQVDAGDFMDYTLDAAKPNLALVLGQVISKNHTNRTKGINGTWKYKRCGIQQLSSIGSMGASYGADAVRLYFANNIDAVPDGYGSGISYGRDWKIFIKSDTRIYECLLITTTDGYAHYLHPKHGDVGADFTLSEWYEWMIFERSDEELGGVNTNCEVLNGTLLNLATAGLIGKRYIQGRPTGVGSAIETIGNPYLTNEFNRGEIDAICELDGNGNWIVHTGLWYDTEPYMSTNSFSRVLGNPIQVIYNEKSPKYTRFSGLPLLVGELGEDLLPDLTEKTFKLTEKCIDFKKRLTCTLVTETYTDGTVGADITENESAVNGRLTTFTADDVQCLLYTAVQSYLQPSVQLPMEEEVFSAIHMTNIHLADRGSAFTSFLLNKISTSTIDPHEVRLFLESYDIRDDLFHPGTIFAPTHTPRALEGVVADSPTIKVFGYPVKVGRKLGICWIWNELHYDDGKDSNDVVLIAANVAHGAIEIGTPFELSGFDNPIINDRIYTNTLDMAANTLPTNSFDGYFIDSSGSVRAADGTLSSYQIWDGDGWGDDSTFKINDGIKFALDANNNVIEYGCAIQMTNKQI